MSDHPFIRDLMTHVAPSSYDGRRLQSCLIGQLANALGMLVRTPRASLIGEYDVIVEIARRYDLPEYCIQAIYLATAHWPYRSNLEAALNMARRAVAMSLDRESASDADVYTVYAYLIDTFPLFDGTEQT